jgi:hypothetical protein
MKYPLTSKNNPPILPHPSIEKQCLINDAVGGHYENQDRYRDPHFLAVGSCHYQFAWLYQSFPPGGWPPHAMYHLLMGLGALLATCGLLLFLTWIPLRRGERWAWFAIAFAAFTVHGGTLIGDLVTDGGSGSVVFAGLLATIVLYGVGLSLTWSSTRPA